MQACSPPSFDKFKEVKLVLQDCNRLESVLLKILEGSPNLECLILDREVDSCDYTAQCSENPLETLQAVPFCLISNLRTISIMRFRGLPEEVEVGKYLLKNSQVLKTMTISTLRTTFGDLEKVHENLPPKHTHPNREGGAATRNNPNQNANYYNDQNFCREASCQISVALDLVISSEPGEKLAEMGDEIECF
ncbi:hypothetical protein ACLB2K_032308 [Fragaria x ananassa]